MAKVTKEYLISKANDVGASVTKTNYNNITGAYEFEIIAPPQKQWISSGSVTILVLWFSEINDDKFYAITNALVRMDMGLEKISNFNKRITRQ